MEAGIFSFLGLPGAAPAIAAILLLGGGAAARWPSIRERAARGDIKRRLKVEDAVAREAKPDSAAKRNREAVQEKALKTARGSR